MLQPTNNLSHEAECPICCDTIDKSLIIRCVKCDKMYCQNCLHHFIMLSDNLMSRCLHCNNQYDIDFIILNTNKQWYDTVYINHRKEILWKNELSLIKNNSTQKAAKAYIDAWECCRLNNMDGFCSLEYLQKKIQEVYDSIVYNKAEVAENRKRLVHVNYLLCIKHYGRGWEDFDFDNNEPRPISTYLTNITFPCPIGKMSRNYHG